jgi:hypothetical protein
MHDFVYKPMPNSNKSPEVFNSLPCLITADWHMCNLTENHSLPSPKALFHGLAHLTNVRRYFNPYVTSTHTLLQPIRYFNPYVYIALAYYNVKPDDRRYLFVVVSQNTHPFQRIRLRRQVGPALGPATYPDDYPDKGFLGITLRDARMRDGLLPVTLLLLRLWKRNRR